MDRIKAIDFLSMPEASQFELILSIQAMRIEGLKTAKLPKVRKTKEGKPGKEKKARVKKSSSQSTEDKALKALKKLSPAQFELIQKLLNKGK
jgi:hypothetical protein